MVPVGAPAGRVARRLARRGAARRSRGPGAPRSRVADDRCAPARHRPRGSAARRLAAHARREDVGDRPDLSRGRLGRALWGSSVYRVGAWLGRTWRSFTPRRMAVAAPRRSSPTPRAVCDRRRSTRALQAGYGAATRPSPGGQRSLTLYGALPIRAAGAHVTGVVLASQSTWRHPAAPLRRAHPDVRGRRSISLLRRGAAGLAALTIVRPLRTPARRRGGAGRPRGRRTRRGSAGPAGATRSATSPAHSTRSPGGSTRTSSSPSASPPTCRTSSAIRSPRSARRPRCSPTAERAEHARGSASGSTATSADWRRCWRVSARSRPSMRGSRPSRRGRRRVLSSLLRDLVAARGVRRT